MMPPIPDDSVDLLESCKPTIDSIDALHAKLKAESNQDRPDPSAMGGGLLWCPFAEIYSRKMPTRGKYPKGYPQGAIVHYTAGRDWTGAIDQGIVNGYCYFLITKDGVIHQSFPLNEWGYHAGKSTWPGLGDGVSDNLVGIEVCSSGVLEKQGDKYKQWYESNPSKWLLDIDVGTVPPGSLYPAPGHYERYTYAQMGSLTSLLLWLYRNKPDTFSLDLVLGHDEVCVPKGRKTDPGGAIHLPMPEYRQSLKEAARKFLPSQA